MSVTTEQVEARVVETLASFGPEQDQITRTATFEELDIDSLDLVELIMKFEDVFGTEISDEDAQKLTTVGEAIMFVDAQKAKK